MKLEHVRLIKDTPEAFHLHDGVASFAVAKNGLDKATHDQIVQHFDAGGKVEYARAAAANSDGYTPLAPPANADSDPAASDSYDTAATADRAQWEAQQKSAAPANPLTVGRGFGAPDASATQPPPAAPGPEQVSYDASTGAMRSGPPAGPDAPPTMDVPPEALPQPAPQTTAAPDKAPAPARVGADPDIARAEKQGLQGIQEQADAARANAETTARIWADYPAKQQAALADSRNRLQQAQARQQALQEGILSKQIDPNHFYDSRSTGQKIGIGIGLILGGLGAGLAGQPSFAEKAVNNAIDRDIDAQKANIENGKSLFATYVQQGHDAIEAGKLARADMQDVVAAQIQQQAASYGGAQAKAQADTASANLRMQASNARQESILRSYAQKEAAIKLPYLQSQLEFQRQQEQVQLPMLKAQAAALGRVYSGQAGPADYVQLPKEMRETMVQTPDGQMHFAASPQAAEEVRKAQAEFGPLRTAINGFRTMLQGGSPVTGDRGTAASQRQALILELGKLHGLNRITDQEWRAYEAQVPDLTDLVKPLAKQKIDELARELNAKEMGVYSAYLPR